MKKLALLAVGLAAACTHEGPRQTEQARVDDLIFSPAQHGTGVGTGFTPKGRVVTTVTSVDIPAAYAVVFECRHGRFVVQGQDDRHEALWGRLRKGQEVLVEFAERLDRDNRVVGYKFYGVK